MQSVFAPMGPQAARIALLWWLMLGAAAVVFTFVVAWMLWAILRHRRTWDVERKPSDERRLALAVSGAVAATVAVLLVFLIADFSTARAVGTLPNEEPLRIEVIGHQWWWEVHYPDTVPVRRVTTANEIHIPVGRPVVLETTSRDVIHSLWVPNLHGKKDLVPGHTSVTWFQADTPGVYRGQCAEFCGHQHAHMALVVVAEEPSRFEEWLEGQRRAAAPPADSLLRRGEQVFLSGTCVMCHTVRGTPAGGRVGPDLTHIASRLTIAAGTMRNTRGSLAAWVSDPQRIKPGVRMPPNQLTPADLHALLGYLESLR